MVKSARHRIDQKVIKKTAAVIIDRIAGEQQMVARLNKISAALALLCSMPLIAQTNTEQNADAQTQGEIEQIVVTGKASGMSGFKVDTSYAITNVSAENIGRLAPKSTAELFTVVPGVWAESSGAISFAIA